jgi:hypothetical protein
MDDDDDDDGNTALTLGSPPTRCGQLRQHLISMRETRNSMHGMKNE